MHTGKEFMKLAEDFRICRPVLVALGDENRLHILYQMMISAEPRGMRVGQIVKMSSLGTKNYYYLDPDMKSFKALISVLERSVEYSSELPYRGEE